MKRTLTKVMASLLAVLMLIGALPFASVAAADNELPEKPWGYNRYYFYQPKDWINEYTDTIGIYWWEGIGACASWPGYVAHKADVEGVYYYDVPQDVALIIWNNTIDGGTDDTQEIYTAAYQTGNIGTEYYDPGESENYPNGTENFDEMIYIIDPEKTVENEFTGKLAFYGEWYYYYGDGQYGFDTPEENSNKVVEMKYVGEEITLYEGVDGGIEVGFDEETGEEYKYSTYKYSGFEIEIEVLFEDGTTRTLDYYDISYDRNFKFYDNQKTEPWNVGENCFYIEYRGIKVEVPVIIIENPVKSIELADDGNIELVENIDGYYDENYDYEIGEYVQYFYYEYSLYGVVLRINYKDGTSEEVSLYNLDDYYADDDQYENPWGLGKHSCTFSYMGYELEIPVTVIKNPVKSIELVDDGNIEIIENVDGYDSEYYDYETDEYVEYFRYTYDASDVVIKVNYTDGTSEEISAYDLDDYYTDDEQYGNPWGLGKHSCTFSYMGYELEIPVTVIKNPVKSIELVDGVNVEIIENVDGYDSSYYDYEKDEYVEYFRYSYDISDVVVKVNYKDGTSEEVSLYDLDNYYTTDDQYGNPWDLGKHSCTLSYMGYELEIPVTVVKGPVVSLELVDDGDVEVVEFVDGYYDTYYDEETDTDVEYFEYTNYDYSDVLIKINYDDLTSVTLNVNELWYEDNYYTDSDQANNPWVVGGENFFTIHYMDQSVDVPVTVVPNLVAGLEVVSDGDIEVVENIDGYYEERYDSELDDWVSYFYYDYSVFDATFKITYTDGTSKVVNRLSGFSADDDQYENPWGLGEHICTVSYMGFDVELPVTVIKNPIESIELVDDGDIEVVELVDGYYDTYYDEETDTDVEYFEYDYYDYDDVELKINYNDGTSETVKARTIWDEYNFYTYSDQAHNPWTIGGENFFTIEYMGHSVEVPVTVVPNPVAGVEVVSDVDVEVMENADGYLDDYYDEELDEFVEYFRYTPDLDDVVLKVTYTDGKTEEVSVVDLEDYSVDSDQHENPWGLGEHSCTLTCMGYEVEIPVTVVPNNVESIEIIDDGHMELVENLDGYYWTYNENRYIRKYFEYSYYPRDVVFKVNYLDGTSETINIEEINNFDYYDDQSEHHWSIGGEHNYYTLLYKGQTAEVPVYIIENPVERIEISPESLVLYEGVDGYWTSEYYDELNENEYFEYNLDWNKVTMTVYFKDGTKETDTLSNFGYSYLDVYSDQDGPWSIGEKHEFFVEYYDHEAVLEVTIAESPVEKIELIKGTNQTYVEYADGWFSHRYIEETGEYESYFSYEVRGHEDAQIKIYFKDGTTKVANVQDEVLGHDVYCYSEQSENPWTPDKDNEAIIEFMGETVALPVEFGESDVESISLVGASLRIEENTHGYWAEKPVNGESQKYYFYDIYEILADREFEIKYKDGKKETVGIDDVAIDWQTQRSDNWLPGKENIVLVAYEGGLLSLSVDIISADALANGTYGDVTCDGKVNIKDATHIQKYAAKLAELTDAEFTFADVNADGKVNVKDATAIQKHLAKFDTGLPIEKPVA